MENSIGMSRQSPLFLPSHLLPSYFFCPNARRHHPQKNFMTSLSLLFPSREFFPISRHGARVSSHHRDFKRFRRAHTTFFIGPSPSLRLVLVLLFSLFIFSFPRFLPLTAVSSEVVTAVESGVRTASPCLPSQARPPSSLWLSLTRSHCSSSSSSSFSSSSSIIPMRWIFFSLYYLRDYCLNTHAHTHRRCKNKKKLTTTRGKNGRLTVPGSFSQKRKELQDHLLSFNSRCLPRFGASLWKLRTSSGRTGANGTTVRGVIYTDEETSQPPECTYTENLGVYSRFLERVVEDHETRNTYGPSSNIRKEDSLGFMRISPRPGCNRRFAVVTGHSLFHHPSDFSSAQFLPRNGILSQGDSKPRYIRLFPADIFPQLQRSTQDAFSYHHLPHLKCPYSTRTTHFGCMYTRNSGCTRTSTWFGKVLPWCTYTPMSIWTRPPNKELSAFCTSDWSISSSTQKFSPSEYGKLQQKPSFSPSPPGFLSLPLRTSAQTSYLKRLSPTGYLTSLSLKTADPFQYVFCSRTCLFLLPSLPSLPNRRTRASLSLCVDGQRKLLVATPISSSPSYLLRPFVSRNFSILGSFSHSQASTVPSLHPSATPPSMPTTTLCRSSIRQGPLSGVYTPYNDQNKQERKGTSSGTSVLRRFHCYREECDSFLDTAFFTPSIAHSDRSSLLFLGPPHSYPGDGDKDTFHSHPGDISRKSEKVGLSEEEGILVPSPHLQAKRMNEEEKEDFRDENDRSTLHCHVGKGQEEDAEEDHAHLSQQQSTSCSSSDPTKFKKEKKLSKKVLKKEIRLTPRIADHDLKVKAKRARGFLLDKNQVNFTIQLRGRERGQPDMYRSLLERIGEMIEDIAAPAHPVKAHPSGTSLSQLFQPRGKKRKSA